MATLDSILSRMADLGTEVVEKNLCLMIYGKPGSGKTVLAVGLAKYLAKPGQLVLYIDTKEGWVSLENHEGMVDGVTRFQYENFSDLALIANALKNHTKTKTIDFGNVGAVVIDELSTACEMLLDDLFRESVGARPDEIPTQEIDAKLYKPLGDATRIAVERFQAVNGVHLIVTAHEREDIDHRKVKVTHPGFTPKNNAGLQKLMHVTAHLTNEIKGLGKNTSYDRMVQSHPSMLVDAKSRIGGLPLTTDTGTFVEAIHSWVYDDSQTFATHETGGLIHDDLPGEGIPVSEEYLEDDEPVLVAES